MSMDNILKRNLWALIVGAIALGFIFSLTAYYLLFIESIEIIPLKGTVSPQAGIAGFDVNTSAISFGRVSQGASSIRAVSLTNLAQWPQEVSFIKWGKISGLVHLPPQPMLLPVNQSQEVNITFSPSTETAPGFYSGKLVMIVWKNNRGK